MRGAGRGEASGDEGARGGDAGGGSRGLRRLLPPRHRASPQRYSRRADHASRHQGGLGAHSRHDQSDGKVGADAVEDWGARGGGRGAHCQQPHGHGAGGVACAAGAYVREARRGVGGGRAERWQELAHQRPHRPHGGGAGQKGARHRLRHARHHRRMHPAQRYRTLQ
eukprot:70364-Prorocentrum_minimum.AAC.1